MYILISNDDGVHSPGLLALHQQLVRIAEVAIVAPERNWSAGGHSRTLHQPLRAVETTLADGTIALACDGTPADCVALAVMGLLPQRPDLVVSGINRGANLGSDVTYSGTVAAAMEGVILGIPSIAVSLVKHGKTLADFEPAAHWAASIVGTAFQAGLAPDMLLNVNVPGGSLELIDAAHVTRLGNRIYHNELIVRHDPHGRPYYWTGGYAPAGHPDDGTDLGAIAAQCVSITPLHLDLTSTRWIEQLQGWSWNRPASANDVR